MANTSLLRPYLVAPKFIEQPTWGGDYIADFKGWGARPGIAGKKIGQSYELFGGSKLTVDITDAADERFGPDDIAQGELLDISKLVADDRSNVLGPAGVRESKDMSLLVKFTQARGNSFQLHKKPDQPDMKWQPKAETWYYFEDGYMTFGIAPGTDPAEYKAACLRIEEKMLELSYAVRTGKTTVKQARQDARDYIQNENPWQYVNVHHVSAGDTIDLSGGGLHHSWEDDPDSALGNILYEVQQDVMDPVSTIRSFDQGKIADDGGVRDLTIEEYFRFLDTDPDYNNIERALTRPTEGTLVSTPRYSLDQLSVNGTESRETESSFDHLFVKEGKVRVTGSGTELTLHQGHSCFVPFGVKQYTIESDSSTTVLRTYIAS